MACRSGGCAPPCPHAGPAGIVFRLTCVWGTTIRPVKPELRSLAPARATAAVEAAMVAAAWDIVIDDANTAARPSWGG